MEGLRRGSFGRVLAAMAATGWLGLLAKPAQAAKQAELAYDFVRKTSRQYPHGNVGEAERRRRQIQRGTLRHDNGLMQREQLGARPDGSLKLRWQ